MPSIQYGEQLIEYSLLIKEGLKSHYITVEKGVGVILKGSPLHEDKAKQLILKKAAWIVNKLEQVKSFDNTSIVTGSRLPYLGRNYYVEVVSDPLIQHVSIEFTYSKFIIRLNNNAIPQAAINTALEEFYLAKAIEKLPPRVRKLSQLHNLPFTQIQIRKMRKRWGSCTADNKIILNAEAIKLPFTLIDYVIIHELCHTKVKDHSKAFWAELSKHVVNWRMLDERMKNGSALIHILN